MRRSAKTSTPKLSADSQRLIMFAQATTQASSRIEERGWERELDTLLHKLLKSNHQETIDAALEQLFKTELDAYDALMESVEAMSESCIVEHDGNRYEALLIALPILAWTRFSIASGPVSADMTATLCAHLYGHVLAPDAKAGMIPMLFAIDQLPRSHAETFTVTQSIAQAVLNGSTLKTPSNPPDTAPFLADTRYLLTTVVVPAGSAMFRWQASMNLSERQDALEQWRTQVTPNITRLLPGCGIELLLPEAYYVACREGDSKIRPISIRAAVHYLTHALGVAASELQAVIGNFGEGTIDYRVDEYRIGFVLRQTTDVVYGVVWPLYGQEEAEYNLPNLPTSDTGGIAPVEEAGFKTPVEEITALLRESGVTHIKHHDDHFPMEFCEDCGAPLYADLEGELMHAEMPADAVQSTGHFH